MTKLSRIIIFILLVALPLSFWIIKLLGESDPLASAFKPIGWSVIIIILYVFVKELRANKKSTKKEYFQIQAQAQTQIQAQAQQNQTTIEDSTLVKNKPGLETEDKIFIAVSIILSSLTIILSITGGIFWVLTGGIIGGWLLISLFILNLLITLKLVKLKRLIGLAISLWLVWVLIIILTVLIV